jgi:hypothetical protein
MAYGDSGRAALLRQCATTKDSSISWSYGEEAWPFGAGRRTAVGQGVESYRPLGLPAGGRSDWGVTRIPRVLARWEIWTYDEGWLFKSWTSCGRKEWLVWKLAISTYHEGNGINWFCGR